MRLRLFHFQNAPGLASTEFALVLPSLMLMVMLVLALAIWAFSLGLTAAGVPTGARQAGITNNAGAGYSETRRLLSVIGSAGAALGATQISLSAPGCERAVYSRLNASSSVDVPMWDAAMMHLRAGSQTRNWQFYPGKPADSCE